jgi:hypothetical protein
MTRLITRCWVATCAVSIACVSACGSTDAPGSRLSSGGPSSLGTVAAVPDSTSAPTDLGLIELGRPLEDFVGVVLQLNEEVKVATDAPPSLGVAEGIERSGSRVLGNSTDGKMMMMTHLYDPRQAGREVVFLGPVEFDSGRTLMTVSQVLPISLEPNEVFSVGSAILCSRDGLLPDNIVATVQAGSKQHFEPAIRAWFFNGQAFEAMDPKGVACDLGDTNGPEVPMGTSNSG